MITKKFTDELLEYQVQSGLIAKKDATKILKILFYTFN